MCALIVYIQINYVYVYSDVHAYLSCCDSKEKKIKNTKNGIKKESKRTKERI